MEMVVGQTARLNPSFPCHVTSYAPAVAADGATVIPSGGAANCPVPGTDTGADQSDVWPKAVLMSKTSRRTRTSYAANCPRKNCIVETLAAWPGVDPPVPAGAEDLDPGGIDLETIPVLLCVDPWLIGEILLRPLGYTLKFEPIIRRTQPPERGSRQSTPDPFFGPAGGTQTVSVSAGEFLEGVFTDGQGNPSDAFALTGIAPAAPANLSATPAADGQGNPLVNLVWDDNANSETGFYAQMKPHSAPDTAWVAIDGNNGDASITSTDAADVSSAVVKLKDPTLIYDFRVLSHSASGASGESAPSNVAASSASPVTVTLGSGTILTSVGGTGNLVPLTFTLPATTDNHEKFTLSISSQAAGEINVYDDGKPSKDSPARLGGASRNATYDLSTQGAGTTEFKFWVGATTPSNSPNDIQFTLTESFDGGNWTFASIAATAVPEATDFFFDGTNNDGVRDAPGGSDTNVYRMALADDPKVAFSNYLFGVGTRTHTSFLGAVTGLGADDIEDLAWTKLVSQLNQGSKYVDIVGFSRGAVEALDFANRLTDSLARIPKLGADGQPVLVPNDLSPVYLDTSQVKIRFLGLYDPVDTFGAIRDFNGGDNENVPAGVTKVSDAVALSEHRSLFDWVDLTQQNATVVGFIGAHADIGGGYGQDGISNTTLHWMMNQAVSVGMAFTTTYRDLADEYDRGQIHDSYVLNNHADFVKPRIFPPTLDCFDPNDDGTTPTRLRSYGGCDPQYWDPDLAID